MEKRNVKTFMIGSLIGGVVGAVTALLFAPKSGSELRSDIAEGYQVVSDKTQEIARNIGTQTTEFIHKAKEVASQVVEGARSWQTEDSDDIEEKVATIASRIVAEEEEEQELVLTSK